MDDAKPKRQHKKSQSGRKAKKKEEAKRGYVEKHNAKAHTFSGGHISVQRRVQRTLNKKAMKERAEFIDKTPDIPPPFVVVVQGPPGVGKSTLIRSLVRHYSKQRVNDPKGPITLTSGRNRRLTFIECPRDIPSMLDLAKVADLALLLADASYGFELETFEFLNMMQVHGFPRVMGVLTHLDKFKENKQLRHIKKKMKKRFWDEIHDGAKLFYLSGLQYGRYHRTEVQNLARFVAVQKMPILSWRQAHPYLLGLRWEDQTPPDRPKDGPRTLHLYGYVNGARLRAGAQVHLAGAGDFTVSSVAAVLDPCAPAELVEEHRAQARGEDGSEKKVKKKNALRSLADRHRSLYAPGSDVGSVTMDADVMYINLPQHEVGFTQRKDEQGELPEAVRLVRELQESEAVLSRPDASLPLVKGSGLRVAPVGVGEDRGGREHEVGRRPMPEADGTTLDAPSDAEEGESSDGDAELEGGSDDEGHRQQMHEHAQKRFQRSTPLEEIIYGAKSSNLSDFVSPSAASTAGSSGEKKPTDHTTLSLFDDDEADEDDGDDTGQRARLNGLLGGLGDMHGTDFMRIPMLPNQLLKLDEEAIDALKSRKFITGGWDSADEQDEERDEEAEGDEHGSKDADAKDRVPKAAGAPADLFADGAAIATYVRVVLEDVPASSVAGLRHEKPIVLGGLLPGETGLGLVQLRVKQHRWHPKLLKSNDAVLLSAGWRRFQTLPVYALEDRNNSRMRFLKYTPEHMHCTATTYCPYLPPNSGVMAFRSWSNISNFRVSWTGNTLESAPDFNVMKKLKLVGEPYKIFKNTAFVKGMFNSNLEVSKFQNAKIQTVSGIRGEIKKSEADKGAFRATFEDRIVMSDLVVCKTWVRVEPKPLYNPMIDVEGWRRMKTIGELRHEQGLLVPKKQDSAYGAQVVRPERKFTPLKIPKGLEAALPFRTKSKTQAAQKRTKLQKQAAVVSSKQEHAVNSMLNRLYTVRKEKKRIRQEANAKKKVVRDKRKEHIEKKREAHEKDNKKKRYIKQGESEVVKQKALRMR